MKNLSALFIVVTLVAFSSTSFGQEKSAKRSQTIDVANSSVTAVGRKITGSHDVFFKSVTGKIEVDNGSLTAISIDIDMEKTTSDNDKLTQHLLSPDFFDAANFPTSTFRSTKVELLNPKTSTYLVQGDLTIRGVTNTVTFPAKVKLAKSFEATAEFTIDRQLFKIAYAGMADDLISNYVNLKIALKTN